QNPSTTCWNQLVSSGGNLFNDNLEGCGIALQTGDLIDVDPNFQALITREDRQPTLLPREGSVAVDSAEGACPDKDLRGLARPQDGDGNGSALCDRGAFEILGDSIFSSRFD
ncbi:MAG: choice-of-anchor Q domain-containing protein, partial [Pseudomonadota bacterium]